jgi:hypothetical protein
MSSLCPLNANAEVRDATSSARTFVNAFMISSVIPSVKNSFSASVLMLVNGSTAIDRLLLSTALAGIVEPNACANSVTVRYRSDGSSESARSRTSEVDAGTFALEGSGAGFSLNRFAITPCGVLAVNGGCPQTSS